MEAGGTYALYPTSRAGLAEAAAVVARARAYTTVPVPDQVAVKLRMRQQPLLGATHVPLEGLASVRAVTAAGDGRYATKIGPAVAGQG
jgi:hypothetical protein